MHVWGERTEPNEWDRTAATRRDEGGGGGGALGAFGGTAAASEHQGGGGESPPRGDDEQATGPEEFTVHTVRTLIQPSTNPERPADFFFQPTGLHVAPGDVVRFVFVTPDHTVTSYHPAFGMQRRIPAGVRPFSSPVMGWDPDSLPDDVSDPPAEGAEADTSGTGADDASAGGTSDDGDGDSEPEPSAWLRGFETPGVYDLECAPHEDFGMAMRVVVGDETGTDFETSDPENLPEPRAGPVGLARLVLTDPALEPDRIVEAGRVEWSELDANESNGGSEPSDE